MATVAPRNPSLRAFGKSAMALSHMGASQVMTGPNGRNSVSHLHQVPLARHRGFRMLILGPYQNQ
jgi:hypothetical protein